MPIAPYMRLAIVAPAMLLVAVAGCTRYRYRPAIAPRLSHGAARYTNAHAAAMDRARVATDAQEPGERADARTYRVADLYRAAPDYWEAVTRHICEKRNELSFNAEECQWGKEDWRWLLARALHLGPGLGQAGYRDHVTLVGNDALRIDAIPAVHHGLCVYFRILREELADDAANPNTEGTTRIAISGIYHLDRAALVRERPYAPGEATPEETRHLAEQIVLTVDLKPDGTWTRRLQNPLATMSGRAPKERTSRGRWSVSGALITFFPEHLPNMNAHHAGDRELASFGILTGHGAMRLYAGSPLHPGEYGFPVRRE